ncbi:MAG: Dam family site-specific DNA-(adenine-N6)-methyltransferase [Proteobacteria bacterium]|jgi:DNA adenine methylase|nr:Dam family site-specific DNA-(adenine-N6)-methyltransferase [Pseudomonadota bacterium]
MKPIVKWAGGKTKLAPAINTAFSTPCAGVYFEPFLGSGAVYLHRRAAGQVPRSVLSDANGKLMAVHLAVRDELGAVFNALDALPGDDWRERYYDIREAYNEGPFVGASHAARFLWLNRACFNGLYRENRGGKYNVPVGSYVRLSLPSREHFQRVSELMQGTELVVSSFEDVMSRASDGDQVYCDPPYVPLSETACFTGYCKTPFGLAEQRLLAEVARQAATRGAQVVLSNHDLPVVREELYPEDDGFRHLAYPMVARAISRNGAGRKRVGEVIASIGPNIEAA